MRNMVWFVRASLLCALCSMVACLPIKKDQNLAELDFVVETIEIDKKTGVAQLVYRVREEFADASTADKGGDTLLQLQRVADVGKQFSYYSVGDDGRIVASLYSTKLAGKNIEDISSDLWIFGKTGRVRVTNSNHVNRYPSFSKSGDKIYFTSERGKRTFGNRYEQSSYVWRTSSSSGGGITRIGAPAFRYSDVQHSPDGKQILMTSQEYADSPKYIWSMEANGALPTQIKKGSQAQWMSNDAIVFASRDDDSGLRTIWTVNMDGTELTQIITDSELEAIEPRPDPSGRYIAFTKTEPDLSVGGRINMELDPKMMKRLLKKEKERKKRKKKSRSFESGFNCLSIDQCREVFIYDTKTGLQQQITINRSLDDQPQWSADGRFLYIRSTRGGRFGIWRLNAQRALADL